MAALKTVRPLLELTKAQAAARQVEAAIQAFELGDFDICITLAGAAEGMFSDRADGGFYSVAAARARDSGIDKKEWNAHLNRERDWLKHPTLQDAGQLSFRALDAALMLVRAMSKLEEWSLAMNKIKPVLIDICGGGDT
jgi:hypothetical protein